MIWAATPTWHESRCTRYRYRYSECARCVAACPHDAITLHDAGASADGARCQHCALCVDACPTQAWESADYRPIAMLRDAIRSDAWSVACTPSGASGSARVPCLGALGPVPMAYLARRGIALSLHGAWHCDGCAHRARGAHLLDEHLQAVEGLRDAVWRDGDAPWAMPTVAAEPARTSGWPVLRLPTPRNPGAGTSRRQLLRGIVSRAGDAIADAAAGPGAAAAAAPPAGAIRAGAYHVPEQRDLLQIVCKRADEQPVHVPIDGSLPLMQLSLQAGCSVCEACFRACPTGALGIDENPGAWTLTFDVHRCVGCEVCVEVCQPRVLTAQRQAGLYATSQPEHLLDLNKQRCARCDRHFVSARPQDHCAVCSDDELAFAAIFG